MAFLLTEDQIEAALPKIVPGLKKYTWIQERAKRTASFLYDGVFQKKYNGFYKVRFRDQAWRNEYYGLMDHARQENLDFEAVLRLLHQATGRWESSFASKLVATLDPSQPVIDKYVLKNLRLKLPLASSPDRLEEVCQLYRTLGSELDKFLGTNLGAFLVTRFRQYNPDASITKIKMLDLVLWQVRE